MSEVGTDLWRSSGSTSLLMQGHLQQVAKISLDSFWRFPWRKTPQLPMFQSVPIDSCPLTEHHWKEPGPILSPLPKVFACMDKITSEPSLFQAEQSQFPQPFLKCFSPFIISVTLYWIPSSTSISLVLRGPEPDTRLKVQPHQCWVERKAHLPPSAGNTLPNEAQEDVILLCSMGSLLGHGQLSIDTQSIVLTFLTKLLSFQPPECSGTWVYSS